MDDLLAFLHLRSFWEEATAILVFLEMIGAPINYEKVNNVFVGFYINVKLHHFALTQVKMNMLLDTARTLDSQRSYPVDLVRSYTHKAAWAVQVIEPLRPLISTATR